MDGASNDGSPVDKPEVIFKKMSSIGVRTLSSESRHAESDSTTNLCEGCNSIDFNSIDSNCYMDNISVETASIDNNCYQDNLSIDNSSINVSMDLHEASESTLDLQEITQSILDLEGTQTSRNSSEYGTSTELQGITQVPSSPPPSYEHVLAEASKFLQQHKTRLAQRAAYATEDDEELAAGGSCPTTDVAEPPVTAPSAPKKGIEIMHKSHKEFYRAVAKQWGITCKMSDHCRCLDCQSMYFDCEYDYNEQEKTDGGLGAGTPMFISEVMHGTACTLL
ncbi:hypothetical protein RUM44_006386 [Polyplax serrata]|uniref:DUF4802 domain-containing protein n=1 Tax=Polyplax serrata TaxID=468196 RepID=A0ABR1AJP2_POLSC